MFSIKNTVIVLVVLVGIIVLGKFVYEGMVIQAEMAIDGAPVIIN
jgi:hypothetical protein